jgi:chromosome segregation ATPase
MCCALIEEEVLDNGTDKEIRMSTTSQDDKKAEYKTPRWVQVWFLRRSRDNWKKKYGKLKADSKLLKNRATDVTKSREKWRQESNEQKERICQLEAENAALQEQLAALKKHGCVAST